MIRKDIYRYEAEEGNFIIRNLDNVIVGESICISNYDPITNYHEEPYTEESYREFYESIGVVFEDETEQENPENNGENEPNENPDENEQEPQEGNEEDLENEGDEGSEEEPETNEDEQEPEEVTDKESEDEPEPEENN